jgi:hypothetical protein
VVAILPPVLTLAGRSNELANFLRQHQLEPNPHHQEIQDLGEKYVLEVLGPPELSRYEAPHSFTSSVSAISVTPRSWTPSPERRNSTADRRESNSPRRVALVTSSSVESLSLPLNIQGVPPVTYRPNLVESLPQIFIPYNPPEAQHYRRSPGTTCQESICCIVT